MNGNILDCKANKIWIVIILFRQCWRNSVWSQINRKWVANYDLNLVSFNNIKKNSLCVYVRNNLIYFLYIDDVSKSSVARYYRTYGEKVLPLYTGYTL